MQSACYAETLNNLTFVSCQSVVWGLDSSVTYLPYALTLISWREALLVCLVAHKLLCIIQHSHLKTQDALISFPNPPAAFYSYNFKFSLFSWKWSRWFSCHHVICGGIGFSQVMTAGSSH